MSVLGYKVKTGKSFSLRVTVHCVLLLLVSKVSLGSFGTRVLNQLATWKPQ